MPDPFRPDAKSQLLREAQVGLSIVAILLALLVYVAFYRITGRGKHIPNHVRNAPVAQIVWPQNDGRVVTREIEMTPQEFRDTRMPKAASVTRSNPKIAAVRPRVSPGSQFQTTKSTLRSPYQTPPSNAAMARVKNFSPDAGSTRKKPMAPIVASFSKPNSSSDFPIRKTPKPFKVPQKVPPTVSQTISFSDAKQPKSDGSVTSIKPPVKPVFGPKLPTKPPSKLPVDPFASASLEDSRLDPKVTKASLEDDGNTFQPRLPKATDVASSKTALAFGVSSKEFQPAPLDKTSNRSSDFVGFGSNSEFKPEPKKQFGNTPSLTTKLVTKSQTHSLSGGLKNPFVDPALDPSRPMADEDNQSVAAKRLPRIAHVKPPAEKKQSEGQSEEQVGKQFRESTLSQREYVAKEGDNFWSIAQSVYNDGRYFRVLYKYNESQVPNFDSIKPGTVIGTPELEDLAKLWPDLCPVPESHQVAQKLKTLDHQSGQIYVTRSGDTVFDIARQRLGQASRYSEILKLNQIGLGREVSHLTPLEAGVQIVMPK